MNSPRSQTQWTPQRVNKKETVCSSVQRPFTPSSFTVSIIPEIMRAAGNQHNQKEWLLDFGFPNLIILTTRKYFETTQISLGSLENVSFFKPRMNQGSTGQWLQCRSGGKDLSVYFGPHFVLSSELHQLQPPRVRQ